MKTILDLFYLSLLKGIDKILIFGLAVGLPKIICWQYKQLTDQEYPDKLGLVDLCYSVAFTLIIYSYLKDKHNGSDKKN